MIHKMIKNHNIGLPPGTPVYVGNKPSSEQEISYLNFDQSIAEMHTVPTIDALPSVVPDSTILWININGLHDIDSITTLAKKYNIHKLTVEDILNTTHQPKAENFEHYQFISLKSIQREKQFHHEQKKPQRFFAINRRKSKNQCDDAPEFIIEHISIIIMKNVLVTFQEMSGDPFGGIRKRILENMGQIRKKGTDYLAYALIDSVVDEYFLALAHLEEDIENFEERAVITNNDAFISEIQDTKKYLYQIKRAMLPLRDNLAIMSRQSTPVTNDELKPFFQDLRENLTNAIEITEHYREWLSNIMDVNVSVLSYQLNKVMKILAVISAIFIPLTFIAGVYGMNFAFMPELNQPWGYPVVLGGMGLIAFFMVLFFKIRRWF